MTNLTDDERFALVGRIATGFALLEWSLARVVSSLLGSSETGQIVVQKLDYSQLSDLCLRLLKLVVTDDGMFGTWKLLLAKLQSLAEQRNLILHSFWRMESEIEQPLRIKLPRRGKAELEMTPTPDSYLYEVEEGTSAAYLELSGLIRATTEAGHFNFVKATFKK